MRRARGCAASIARGRVARAGDLKSLCSPEARVGHERSHDVFGAWCAASGATGRGDRASDDEEIIFVPVVRSQWRC